MNRRKFLGSAKASLSVSAVALTATWPGFLRRAFAGPGPSDAAAAAAPHQDLDGLAVVSESYRRAQRAGKPLLVLIIPQDDAAKWTRGRAFGAWLNHGRPEQLWALSLAEVACAQMDDLRRLVPTVGLGDPLMILVETDAVPATVIRLDGKLTEINYRGLRGASMDDYRQQQTQEDALVDSHIATLSRLANKGLCADDPTVSRRIAQAKSVLSANNLARLAHGETPPELVDRGAALVASSRSPSADRTALLASVATARLGRARVPGSHWAKSLGCGTHIEGHPDVGRGIMCGMGHVPEKCGRFLYFYTIPATADKPGGTIL